MERVIIGGTLLAVIGILLISKRKRASPVGRVVTPSEAPLTTEPPREVLSYDQLPSTTPRPFSCRYLSETVSDYFHKTIEFGDTLAQGAARNILIRSFGVESDIYTEGAHFGIRITYTNGRKFDWLVEKNISFSLNRDDYISIAMACEDTTNYDYQLTHYGLILKHSLGIKSLEIFLHFPYPVSYKSYFTGEVCRISDVDAFALDGARAHPFEPRGYSDGIIDPNTVDDPPRYDKEYHQ